MKQLALGLFAVAAVLVGCDADTQPGSGFGEEAGVMRANVNWDQGDGPGEWWFRYRPVGSQTWTEGPRHGFGDQNGSGSHSFDETVIGLQPDTTYEFEFCGYGDRDHPTAVGCFDADGSGSSSTRDTFTTNAVPEMQAQGSSVFLDTIGMNTRSSFAGTPHGNHAQVKQALLYMGARHARDSLWPSWETAQHNFYRDLSNTTSIKGTLSPAFFGNLGTACDGNARIDEMLNTLRGDAALRSFVTIFDSSNEPDFQAGFSAACMRSYQQHLYQQVKGDPLFASKRVLGPSLNACRDLNVGDLGPWVDNGNCHPYPSAHPPGSVESDLDPHLDRCKQFSGGKPCHLTEVGYHTDSQTNDGHRGVSEAVRAAYTLRFLLENFQRGVPETDLYTVVSQWCGSRDGAAADSADFGFYDCNWQPLAGAHALHNFTAVLGSGTVGGSLRLRVGDAGSDLRTVLLRRSDGSYSLMLWRQVSLWNRDTKQELNPASDPMEVVLNRPAAQVQRYQPTTSETVQQSWTNQRKIPVNMDGTVTVLRITP